MANNYDQALRLKEDEALFLIKKLPILEAQLSSACPTIDLKIVQTYAFECACVESEQLGKPLLGLLFTRRCNFWRYQVYFDILKESAQMEEIADKVNDYLNTDHPDSLASLKKKVENRLSIA